MRRNGKQRCCLTLSFLLLVAVPVLAGEYPAFNTVCAGAEQAQARIVFLQGIITRQPQTDYTAMLDKLGRELNIRFAIPHSDILCRNSKTDFCWGTDTQESVDIVYRRVQASAGLCFASGQWALLGFSNGGYFVGRMIARGQYPAPVWAMAIGSAGSPAFINPFSTLKTTPFYMYIGSEDITRPNALQYFMALASLGFNVQYDEFEGKHELTADTLRILLKNIR